MKREFKPSTAVVPAPVVLLSVKGNPTANIITLSWVANVCSDPPSIAVGIRPNRHSHALVKTAGSFVLNIPSASQLENVVFCGTKSGRDYDKFTECGFTQISASEIDSPMIAECPINIECKTTKIVPLGAHDLFIAEVLKVHITEDALNEAGRLDVDAARPFTYVPLTGEYWSLGSKM